MVNEGQENMFSEALEKPLMVTTKDGREFVLLPKVVFERLSKIAKEAKFESDEDNLNVRLIKYLEPKDLPF